MAPKCILQNIIAKTWRKHGLLQHLSPIHTSTYAAAEKQNPTSTKPPLRKARLYYIYIYIERERDIHTYTYTHIHIYIHMYIYIYIYIYTHVKTNS